MSKIPEKFSYLEDVGEGLLHRLYYTRNVFANPKTRPMFLGDQGNQKVLKTLMSKFPEFPETEKIQGYELLTGRAKILSDEMEQHYEAFVDSVEWRDAALLLLTEVGSTTSSLTLAENPVLTEQWLDLMVLYVKVHILAGLISDRRVIAAVYFKMFYHIRSSLEPAYQKVSKWIIETETPFRKLQDEFRVINDAMGKALMPFMMSYMKCRTINILRKEGAINLTLKPEEITRPIQDQGRVDLAIASKVYQWIVYGFLCTPGTLGTPGAVDLAKFALSEAFLTPVFRDISVPLYTEYDSLFANYKSKTLNLAKQKKTIKEAATSSVQEGGRRHLERRIYVRQELEALWHLFRDKPCLLAPKILVLYAAMSLAKEELFWYFRHTEGAPPEKLKKHYKAEEFKDKRISSLMHLLDNLTTLVQTHKKLIISYYLEFMAGADQVALLQLLDTSFMSTAGTQIAGYAQAILHDLQGINVDAFESGRYTPNFKNLRDNWLRVEALMSHPSSSAPISKYKALAHRFYVTYLHSRNVDLIEEMLEEYANFRAVWYYKDSIFAQQNNLFDALIVDGPDQPLHAMTFLRLLAAAPSNATQYWPEERDIIGAEAANIANAGLAKVATRIATILHTVATHYIQNDYQMSDANAAVPLLKKRKDWKPPKDFQDPTEPGSESVFKNRAAVQMETLRLYQRNAFQLCTALNEVLEITIYDTTFVPREYLRERMGANLRAFMRKAIATPAPDGLIHRPSIVEMQIRVYASVLSLVENYVDLDVGEMLREVLLGEAYARPLGKIGRADWFPEGDIDFSEAMIGTIAKWYADFLSKRVFCFSPLRLAFVAKPGAPAGVLFRAEEYADYVELQALARIVGPYGIKLIEREILRYILSNIAGIKESIAANVATLDDISANYHKEAKCNEALRKLRDVDTFVTRSIAVGNALELRKLLHSAMETVAQSQAPYMFNVIHTAFDQYARNTFMFPEFLPTDVLAADIGVDVETADQTLKVMLRKAAPEADKKLWDLLPVMYAVSFSVSTVWREAQYKPFLEGHLNNAHTLLTAIDSLITAFSAITVVGAADEATIAAQLYRYVEISAIILLRMARAKADKHGPVDFPSVITFLDRFVQASPMLTNDMLERCLPYALLRNMYKQIYEDKLVGAKSTDAVANAD
jgi:NCK-associated protein 1